MCCGIASWLAVAQIQNGAISIATTGLNPPLLAGNIIAFGVSLVLVVGISLIFPAKSLFDWVLLKEQITTSESTVRSLPAPRLRMHSCERHKALTLLVPVADASFSCAQVKKQGALDASAVESDADMEEVARIRKPVKIAVAVIFVLAMIVWPLLTLPAGGTMRCACASLPFLRTCLKTWCHVALPAAKSNPACLFFLPSLDGSTWLCSLGYFRFYVVLGFIFLTAATAIGIFLPIWEARDLFFRVGAPAMPGLCMPSQTTCCRRSAQ